MVEALGEPDWIAEEPEAHLVPHIERVCGVPGSTVRLAGWSVEDAGTLVVRLVAADGASALDRRSRGAAALGVVAAVAETRTVIHERPDGAFDVVTGVIDGDTDFAAHGHRLRIVLEEAPA